MTPTLTRRRRTGPGTARTLALLSLIALGTLLVLGAAPAAGQGEPQESCIDCHSDTRFLVRNKKLYDYFRGWERSVHALEGVTCADCHGGNPRATERKQAHGGASMGSAAKGSALNYRNVPDTCAKCHEDIAAAYRTSLHAEALEASGDEQQGPNCVTCHGSVNTTLLSVATVRATCEQCHNEKTDNSPEVPSRAEHVLNHFLSINRYYRYIHRKSAPADVHAFHQEIDPVLEELAAQWHTFDLDSIDERTELLVRDLKKRRQGLGRKARDRHQ